MGDIKNIYSVNVEDELTSILSEELAKSIDTEIIYSLIYDGMIESVDLLIRESNINVILHNTTPYTNDYIIRNSYMGDKSEDLPIYIHDKLNDYINEKMKYIN